MNKKSGLLIGLGLLLIATLFIVFGGIVTDQDNLTYEEPNVAEEDLLPGQEMEVEIEKDFVAASDLDLELNDNPDAYLIDVRNPNELDAGYIEGMVNIPLPSLNEESLQATLPNIDKNDKIYVYCKSGGRSKRAMEKLIEAGYTNVTSVDGGFSSYDGMRVVGM
jgi:rhodanese-related sulfurtransferase